MPHHREVRRLPFPPDQVFSLVADIKAYPEFIPWCEKTLIRKHVKGKDRDLLEADLIASFKVYRARLSSIVWLHNDRSKIDISYLDGPLKHLESTWHFLPDDDHCKLVFEVDFEFRNAILRKVAGVVFTEAMQRIAGAFEARAWDLYGERRAGSQKMLE